MGKGLRGEEKWGKWKWIDRDIGDVVRECEGKEWGYGGRERMKWEVREHIYRGFAITLINIYIYNVTHLVTSGTGTIRIKTISMSRFLRYFHR